MKKIRKTLIALSLLTALSSSHADTELTVSTWGSPKHGINTIVWPQWGEAIKKATNGRVTLNVVYDLAPPNSQMDTIADGIADVSWLFHGHYPGRFTTAYLPEFPTFKNISSEKLSSIYWDVFDKYLKKAKEYRNLVVLGVGVHGPGTFHLKKTVSSLADLAEKRIRVGGGVMAELAKKMNIAGVAMPPTAIYELAAQGVVDGTAIDVGALKDFRLAEVLPFTLNFPGGLYRGSFSIVINADKWDEISSEDQKAIMAVSGAKLSALFGKMFDIADTQGKAFAESLNNTFAQASKQDIDTVKRMASDMPKKWLKDNANKGFDAQAAMDYYNSLINK